MLVETNLESKWVNRAAEKLASQTISFSLPQETCICKWERALDPPAEKQENTEGSFSISSLPTC